MLIVSLLSVVAIVNQNAQNTVSKDIVKTNTEMSYVPTIDNAEKPIREYVGAYKGKEAQATGRAHRFYTDNRKTILVDTELIDKSFRLKPNGKYKIYMQGNEFIKIENTF